MYFITKGIHMVNPVNNNTDPAPAVVGYGGYGSQNENPLDKQLHLLLLIDFIKGADDQMKMLKAIEKECKT